MEKIKKVIFNFAARMSVGLGVFSALLFGLRSQVLAAEYSFLPDYLNKILTKVTDDPQHYVNERVKAGLTILFIVVFLVAIAFSALAAIKFISSQGDASKLEESKGAVKAILMGFAAMIIAVVGLIITIWLLGGGTEVPQEIPITEPS